MLLLSRPDLVCCYVLLRCNFLLLGGPAVQTNELKSYGFKLVEKMFYWCLYHCPKFNAKLPHFNLSRPDMAESVARSVKEYSFQLVKSIICDVDGMLYAVLLHANLFKGLLPSTSLSVLILWIGVLPPTPPLSKLIKKIYFFAVSSSLIKQAVILGSRVEEISAGCQTLGS